MTPEQQTPPAGATDTGVPPLAPGYAPMVGDRFRRPPGTRSSPLDADPVPTPERLAVVTMVSPGHVVVLIDGYEHTIKTGDFIRIAENTLKAGSTLTRA